MGSDSLQVVIVGRGERSREFLMMLAQVVVKACHCTAYSLEHSLPL
jgi:hypothetical protein